LTICAIFLNEFYAQSLPQPGGDVTSKGIWGAEACLSLANIGSIDYEC
jgi:hypothetical protein